MRGACECECECEWRWAISCLRRERGAQTKAKTAQRPQRPHKDRDSTTNKALRTPKPSRSDLLTARAVRVTLTINLAQVRRQG